MYILDSSALIELLQNRPRAPKIRDALGNTPIALTTISLHELLVGARTFRQKEVINNVAQSTIIFEHTVIAAREGAAIEQELERKGTNVNAADILIAGICKSNARPILTCDKDFAQMPGITVKLIN